MKIGTYDPFEAPSGDVIDRWWLWSQGRRRYTRVEPTADKEASARRKRRHHFRVAHQEAQQPVSASKMTVRSMVKRALVRAAVRRKLREAQVISRALRAERGGA